MDGRRKQYEEDVLIPVRVNHSSSRVEGVQWSQLLAHGPLFSWRDCAVLGAHSAAAVARLASASGSPATRLLLASVSATVAAPLMRPQRQDCVAGDRLAKGKPQGFCLSWLCSASSVVDVFWWVLTCDKKPSCFVPTPTHPSILASLSQTSLFLVFPSLFLQAPISHIGLSSLLLSPQTF